MRRELADILAGAAWARGTRLAWVSETRLAGPPVHFLAFIQVRGIFIGVDGSRFCGNAVVIKGGRREQQALISLSGYHSEIFPHFFQFPSGMILHFRQPAAPRQ